MPWIGSWKHPVIPAPPDNPFFNKEYKNAITLMESAASNRNTHLLKTVGFAGVAAAGLAIRRPIANSLEARGIAGVQYVTAVVLDVAGIALGYRVGLNLAEARAQEAIRQEQHDLLKDLPDIYKAHEGIIAKYGYRGEA